MKLIKFLKSGIIALVLTFTATFASAGGHFDANNHDASMLSEAELKAMVDEAMKVNPPKNGKNYVFGFANLQRDIAFCALVEEGILANAEAAGIEVEIEEISDELNKGFFSSLLNKRPYVRAKIAMSEDQKIAFKENDQQWITSMESREDGQKYRALSDLILTGSGTVLTDNPYLNVRNKELINLKGFAQPAKGLISSSSVEPSLNFFSVEGKKIIFCNKKDVHENFKNDNDVSIVEIDRLKNNKIDLKKLLTKINSLKFNDVLLEAGPSLITSFINEDLIDEFIIYIAPKMLSNTALSFFNGDETKSPFNSSQFELADEERIKDDKKLIFKRI